MEVPDPEIPGIEDDIQKDQIQNSEGSTEQIAASDVQFSNNIFIISIPIATCCSYITYVYRADMKLKGHRNHPYFFFLSDIQYHKLLEF